jgi:TolB protein
MTRSVPFSGSVLIAGVLSLHVPAPQEALQAQDAPAPVVVSDHPGTYPMLSPDGQHLLFSGAHGGTLKLFRQDLRTGSLERLTSGPCEDSAASWSPDGTTIVFQREDSTGNRDLWEINANGSLPRNLTPTPDISEQHPRYTPDGRSILFDSDRDDAQRAPDGSVRLVNYELYQLQRGDSTPRRLTYAAGWDMYVAANPAGTHIVWRRGFPIPGTSTQQFDLFTKDLRSGLETNVTVHAAYDGTPDWSPDGRWIAFVSARDGGSNLYLMRADGSALRQLTFGRGRELSFSRPTFAPDGRSLIATRTADGTSNVVRILF